MYVPDNYDAWKAHEARVYRQEVREKKREYEEDIELSQLPFYEEVNKNVK